MTYWLNSQKEDICATNEGSAISSDIVIVGSGLSGVSAAYHIVSDLDKLDGIDSISIIDDGSMDASYFRNAGHILCGMGESYQALRSIHGSKVAKDLMSLSIDFTNEMKKIIENENIKCDYNRGSYYVIPIDDSEETEIFNSINLMEKDGISTSVFIDQISLRQLGFNTTFMGRSCSQSASAHPADFRNALLQICIDKGVKYQRGHKVTSYTEHEDGVTLKYANGDKSNHTALILATNAYNGNIVGAEGLAKRIEPFKGQIIVSKPLKKKLPQIAFSLDHGYIYGQYTPDNRILIGGWRNNIPGGETGTLDLTVNKATEDGLKSFVDKYMRHKDIEWEYSWAGVMGASKGGVPIIGPLEGNGYVYTLSGFNGYGFGFAFGSGKILSKILLGEDIPSVIKTI